MSLALIRTLLWTDPFIITCTAVMGTLSLMVAPFDKHGNRQLKLARIWARMLCKGMGIRVKVEGLERLSPNQNYIFACNHLSYTDTPAILANIPSNFRFMAKKGLFSIPLMGHHLKTAGHIPVSLDNPREAARSMTNAGKIIKERGQSVLIFPEGGRTEGVLEPFKEGVAYIAIKSGLPVVPMALIGTREIMPMHGVTIRGGPVLLQISDPIYPTGYSLHERDKLTHEIRERIASLLGTPATAYTQPS